jgi:hypothetical protein
MMSRPARDRTKRAARLDPQMGLRPPTRSMHQASAQPLGRRLLEVAEYTVDAACVGTPMFGCNCVCPAPALFVRHDPGALLGRQGLERRDVRTGHESKSITRRATTCERGRKAVGFPLTRACRPIDLRIGRRRDG